MVITLLTAATLALNPAALPKAQKADNPPKER